MSDGMTVIERWRWPEYEAGALDALAYVVEDREDLCDLTLSVAEKIGADITAHRRQLQGAVQRVEALRAAMQAIVDEGFNYTDEYQQAVQEALDIDFHAAGGQ